MTLKRHEVSSVGGFVAATRDASIGEIVVSCDLTSVPTIKLRPGQQLTASNPQTTLHFAGGSDGIQLLANNKITHLKLVADDLKSTARIRIAKGTYNQQKSTKTN